MAMRGKDQRNLWVDKDFLNWLKNLKAKKQLNGESIGNLGDLTKEIMKAPAINEVENQILKATQKEKNITNIRIKLDANRLFG
jgi:hypothetical protein